MKGNTMTSQTALKFGQFIDLIMARLLEREQETPAGYLIDLNHVARELNVNVPDQWVFDAGNVLESRGWAQVIFTFGGRCQARLTGEGRLDVEEERGNARISCPTFKWSSSSSGSVNRIARYWPRSSNHSVGSPPLPASSRISFAF